jgi:subtilisin family serine protease
MLGAALTTTTALGCRDSTPPELTQPAKIILVSGDNQSTNGALAPLPLVVQVTDPRNEPVPGVAINWATTDPGASVSASSSLTDGEGRASVSWTLGTGAGRQTVTATTPALPGAAVVFQGNGGGVLSGGVTVQSAPPVVFSASLSRGAPETGLSPLTARRSLVQPALSASHLETAGRATRRLLVQFRATAGAMRIATGGSVMDANMRTMRGALAGHLSARRAMDPELSPAILTARVTVPAGVSLDEARASLLSDPAVEAVTEDRIYPMLQAYSAIAAEAAGTAASAQGSAPGAAAGTIPNDPLMANALWHYNLVDAPRAWKTNTGSRNVLVAVVDNGIRFDHPSMGLGTASNITSDGYNFVTAGDRLSAPEPVCGGGGVLGATTTLHEAGPGPDPTQPDDFDGYASGSGCWVRSTVGNHGLHVAGTIGAVGNDGVGVTGLNWAVSIRPVRVLDVTGSGSYFDIAQGVLYAAGLPAASGATTVQAPSRAAIINMSLGGPGNLDVLRNAVTAATAAGSLIVASAGNSESSAPSYPAGYPEVLATSAIGPDLSISSYTNIGGNVSLAAPGGNFRSSGSAGVVSSTWNFVSGTPSYAYYQGTSMSAPHVSGVAALVLASSPGLTNAQLRARLQSTAVHLGAPGRNNEYGYGIVNAYNAITNSNGPARTIRVRAVNATTGVAVQTVTAAPSGSFTFTRLPAAAYLVYAGHDEDGDGQIGVPGRRFGWHGGPGAPTPIVIGMGGNGSASLSIGTPVESKPHLTTATANRLVTNSYIVGQITATDGPGVFSFVVPAPGTYYFEAAGVLGSCGLGVELNTKLELLDTNGTVLAASDNIGPPSASNPLGLAAQTQCSVIARSDLTAGTTYYLRVSGSAATSTGQYRLWVRDQP